MTAKDILMQLCATLPDQHDTDQFVDAFLNFVGTAHFDAIDEENYPELNILFDLCVQYQDQSNVARRHEIALHISNLAATISDSAVRQT